MLIDSKIMKDKKTNKIMKGKKSENYKNKDEDKKTDEVKLSRVFYYYWKYAKKYKWWFLLVSILVSAGSVGFQVGVPYISKKMVDVLTSNEDWSRIMLYFWLILSLFFVATVINRTAAHLAIKYGVECLNDLIKFTFAEITNKSMSFFNGVFGGALINQMEKFVVSFDVLRQGLTEDLLKIILKVIFAIGIIFWVDYRIGVIFTIWFMSYIVVTALMFKKKMVLDYNKARLVSKRIGTAADTIGNMLNLKSFSAYNREQEYYSQVTDNSRDAVRRSWYWGNLQTTITGLSFVILEFFALGIGLKLWREGELTVGDIILIQGYVSTFLVSLWSIDNLFRRIVQAISDAKEMVAIFDQEVEVQDIKGAKELQVSQGEIVFQDAVFSYPNQKENVFNKFNLTIPAGQTVGLVGTSGAGKTTITKLLLRFSDLSSGKILIDNQDISKVTQDSLRNQIGYVPQEPVLFHRSIYENIAYAKPGATEKEVLEAAKKSYVDEFAQTLEQGYDTMVGERGVKLSGGQKQRIAIARAFLKNAPILILDEATSALDSVSEELIQDALFKLMQNKTVIVVAHRLSTVQRLDRILVIEDGKILEDGNHEELLQKRNGLYAGFWKKQTKKFE